GGELELLGLDFVAQFSGATFEVFDFFGTGLRGQGASAEFGPEPIEVCGLLANALIEAAVGGVNHYQMKDVLLRKFHKSGQDEPASCRISKVFLSPIGFKRRAQQVCF